MNVNEFNCLLESFKIKATCVDASNKEFTSSFLVELSPGFRVKGIEKFSDELSLALKAQSKPTIKPNMEKGQVEIKFIMKKPPKLNVFDLIKENIMFDHKIPFVIGKTYDGKIIHFDMSRNPHILLAGCTGSGKSTMLHNFIANALINQVKSVLIDTKNVEFAPYKGKKFCHVATSYGEALSALKALDAEMENRYKTSKLNSSPIICFIDEYADLISQADDATLLNKLICKIAQKSRAANIHMILATQRPSVDVVNPLVKANFPARISCKLFSVYDSRTILDTTGANDLMDRGDAIIHNYMWDMERFQPAFCDTTWL